MHPRLQPYVSQAWIDEVEVVSAAAQDAASVGQAGGGGGGAAGRSKPAMPGAGSQPGSQPGLLPPAAAFSNDVSYDIFERPSGRPSNQSDGDGWADGGWATSQGGGESSSEEEEDEDEDEEDYVGPQDYGWLESGSKWLRGRVATRHDGVVSVGTITKWVPADAEDEALWHMAHDDGDGEDLDEAEVEAALKLYAEVGQEQDAGQVQVAEEASGGA